MVNNKTLAFVIKRRPWKEFHQIFWLFTETQGLMLAAGFGVSHFGSKRSAHLDIGNMCEIELEKRKNYWCVRHAQAIETYPKIKKDLLRSGTFLTILHALSKITPIEMQMPSLFQFLQDTVSALGETKSTASNMRLFYETCERKMLKILGYSSDMMNVRPEHIRDHLERSYESLQLFV